MQLKICGEGSKNINLACSGVNYVGGFNSTKQPSCNVSRICDYKYYVGSLGLITVNILFAGKWDGDSLKIFIGDVLVKE